MGNNPARMVDPLGLKNYMHDYHSTTTATSIYGGAGRREYNPGRNADEFNTLSAALAMGAHDLKIRSQFYEISGMFKGVGTGLTAGNNLRGGAQQGFTEDQVKDAEWLVDKTGSDRYFAHRWVTDGGDIRTLRRETAQFMKAPEPASGESKEQKGSWMEITNTVLGAYGLASGIKETMMKGGAALTRGTGIYNINTTSMIRTYSLEGAKYFKYSKALGVFGAAISTSYSTSKVIDQHNSGGWSEVAKHRDVYEAGVGAVG